MTISPLGDSAVVITLGDQINEATLLRVRSLTAALEVEQSPAIIDVVPAYSTVTVFYEIAAAGGGPDTPYERIRKIVAKCLRKIEDRWPDRLREELERRQVTDPPRVVEIPVCYGGDFGPDLEEVARHAGLGPDDVVRLHAGANYDVYAVGFAPGFPYLGGLPERLHTPRRATPRVHVPAGSVGIGGAQTGVYPLSTPGGWQLIGRTPRSLFNVRNVPPALLRVGERVRFRSITTEEFAAWN